MLTTATALLLLPHVSATAAPLTEPVGTSAPRASGDDLSADEILDAVYANYGDAEHLAGIENRVFEGTASFGGMPGEGRIVETIGGIGLAHIVTSFPSMGEFKEGAGYGVVWEINPMFGGGRVKSTDEAMLSIRQYGLQRHTPWRTLFRAAELEGKETLADREVYRVKLHPRRFGMHGEMDGSLRLEPVELAEGEGEPLVPDVWYVDTETHEVNGMDVTMQSPMGSQMLEIRYSDYRRVDGALYPFERAVKMMGMVFEVTYDAIRHDVDLADDAFHVPAEVREAMNATLGYEEGLSTETTIEERDEQHVAAIRFRCKPADLAKEMAIVLPEVMVHLTSIGAEVNGAPYSRYFEIGDDEMDLECGIPIAKPIEAKGRIQPGTLPGGHVVSAWHVGPYHELGKSHDRMMAWIAENGIEVTGPVWEVYWTDPGMEPDESKWRTQLFAPCAKP